MKELTKSLKKEQSAKNSDYQRQMYKKYRSDREREKAYINATLEMYAKVEEMLKMRLEYKDYINKYKEMVRNYEHEQMLREDNERIINDKNLPFKDFEYE